MPGKLTALVALLLAVPALGAAASTLGRQGQSQVTGDPLNCPDGSSVQSEFRLENDTFSVTGLLVSLDAQGVTVEGPSGNVTAGLTVNAEVDTGLQPGVPVTAEGALFDQGTTFVASEVHSACNGGTGTPQPSPSEPPSGSPTDTPAPGDTTPAPGDPTPTPTPAAEPDDMPDDAVCNRGPGRSGELRLIIHGDRVDIKRGTVSSSSEGLITVMTPLGDLSVFIDGSTKVKGDLALATEVWAKGTLVEDGVHADQVKVLCPHEAHQDGADDDDDGDDAQRRSGRRPPCLRPPPLPVIRATLPLRPSRRPRPSRRTIQMTTTTRTTMMMTTMMTTATTVAATTTMRIGTEAATRATATTIDRGRASPLGRRLLRKNIQAPAFTRGPGLFPSVRFLLHLTAVFRSIGRHYLSASALCWSNES